MSPVGGTRGDRRTAAEMKQRLATLPKTNCTCGHFAVPARDFYARDDGRLTVSNMACVDCYREYNRLRQSGGTPATPALQTAGHRYKATPIVRDQEELDAIGVLRDKRAQRAGKQGYVYLITDSEYVKVGYSVNPNKRCAELQTGNARLLVVLATIKGTLADEARLHAKYSPVNKLQEWFELDFDLIREFTDSNDIFKKDHEA